MNLTYPHQLGVKWRCHIHPHLHSQ
jgi:hypothetical protein